ncbi:2-hydroxymuconate tautomerase [Neobacillus terrae]|uniref:2-hydroxymuconate tautomerase n=1 Tax=Neobacillus terrae TaxID=3034837 RepID=UPI00140DD609|nr:2-hydroxymuconate tautomerase [Neobacillus terrae]NHM32844.1 4-oxalocrotonate tautomerase family protein [Neobacillus terrae]
MPIIQVQMLKGRSPELKKQLISEITDTISRTLGSPPEAVRVILTEVPEENWGVGGVPINEKN